MSGRRAFIRIMLGAAVSPSFAAAQPTPKLPRVGFLSAGSRPSPNADAFRDGLAEVGWSEGRNVVIEWRFAEGRTERVPELAVELVRLPVAVIVTGSTPVIQAAKDATSTIPIVMAVVADPVASGFVASLPRPGGNITGLTLLSQELSAKRMEILKQAVPRLARLAILWNPANPSHAPSLKETEVPAKTLGVELRKLEVRQRDAIGPAFAAMVKAGDSAVFVLDDPLFFEQRELIADLALRHRVPSMFGISGFVTAGGLMSYGAKQTELYRRAAFIVDKILKGAKPADLPVEQPTKFELSLNLKTAKALGLTISRPLLLQAEQVIQ
jgi:putative tryptophan/tyrosine transport system substrate-binding protein